MKTTPEERRVFRAYVESGLGMDDVSGYVHILGNRFLALLDDLDELNAELAELKAQNAKRSAFWQALAEEGIIT